MQIPLTIATWDYDRVRALVDGRIGVEGCEVNYLTMPVEECFHRAYFHNEFEVAEIGFSPFLIACSRGLADYVALPVFLSRTFRHSCVYIRRNSGIECPSDLRGRRVGVPEYQMSAALWARGFLKDDFQVEVEEISWVQGGLETPGRRDKFPLNVDENFPLSFVRDATLSDLLARGEIDAIISARAPSCFYGSNRTADRLFPDFRHVEADYFRRTGIFPIMHALGIRRDVAERHPWLPSSLCKAFTNAKKTSQADLAEVTALKVGLPWVAAEYETTVQLMGEDFWSYGVAPNLATLEAMTRYSFEQGLATRKLSIEEIFAESTLDEISI